MRGLGFRGLGFKGVGSRGLGFRGFLFFFWFMGLGVWVQGFRGFGSLGVWGLGCKGCHRLESTIAYACAVPYDGSSDILNWSVPIWSEVRVMIESLSRTLEGAHG